MEQRVQCLFQLLVAVIKLRFLLQLVIRNSIQFMTLLETLPIQQDVAMDVVYFQSHFCQFQKVLWEITL